MMSAALHVIPSPGPPRLTLVPKSGTSRLELLQARALDFFMRECLALNESDARQLEKAFGWDAQLSFGLGVRSVPSDVFRLIGCAAVRAELCDLDVWPPGFYTDDSDTLRFDLDKKYGLVVPVVGRWIRGLQYYRHAKDDSPVWISSASRPTGSHMVASIHVADSASIRQGPEEAERVFLVNHTLEAMAVCVHHRVSCAALNGVSLRSLPAQLLDALPNLRAVVVALKEPYPTLERELKDASLSVTFWEGSELL
jgi:hypothetical protein